MLHSFAKDAGVSGLQEAGLAGRLARGFGAPICLIALLSGCLPAKGPAPAPQAAPDTSAAAPARPDAETLKAADYYRRVQAFYLSQGGMRTDSGRRDAPFDARDLATNFLKIAFYDEFSDQGGKLVEGGAQQALHRWQGPVRVSITFSPGIQAERQARITAETSVYLARLSRLTGLPISLASAAPNFSVMILSPADRRAAAPGIRAFAPGTSEPALRSVLFMKPDIYCTAFSYSTGKSPVYDKSLAVIRSELPDLMTKACLHEEIAQGLGLVNDSPKARPSIFNDNEEFALLTPQDEMMLRILYDRRLHPGMSMAEARPIVETIAAELLPGES